MRIYNKVFSFFILLVGSIVLNSCDDKLDLEPLYSQDADSYFSTPADYERALVGAYDLMQTSYLNLWIGEIASDNAIAGGESVNDTQGLHEIEAMNHNAVNNELRSVFQFNYAGITRTNYLFINKDNIDFPGKEVLFGEAHFLRAYYYFQLVKYFGDVPLIVDKFLGADEVTTIGRTPSAEVYAQIEADLIAASEVLDWTVEVEGKVTKGAALALLGRVYLYQDKFEEASQVLEQVINEGPYSLITTTSSEEYTDLFSVNQEGNSESVFEIQYSGQEGGSYGCLVCLEGFAAVGFQGIRQYEGPVYGDGNSYNLPTQDLYEAYALGDIRRNGTVLNLDEFISEQPNAAEISYAVGGGGHTGFYNNKYIKRQDELGLPDNDLTSPVNYRLIRLPDVYLMAAEAFNRKNGPDDAKALGYLNDVRERVGMPEVNFSGEQLTEAIWAERRLELSGEGFRFWDLVRTGRAAQEIDGFTAGKNELFPIPQIEIDLAGGNWNQNPNY
ncbi:membrane protein [Marivirga tractuosa]|uniref:RagB/SusD domain protein n=1 Tax=Marivirga tractuosa (strain ATCC 23168 / DSM 4126 / NBRC 15989 / NCIMB 1408 / VKM B-1430 / H-43) TaxID=643867 RepID=E4TKI5_MARTH|nr:RagB/SusD family nutrient uptake outer membrane protein [Marivirga tractuosa]ADR20165.1 RagB/SusD domain protein [Marivirga tractuosa DSM 4126]BDD15394.1 membrane protein [Marivirga tractuosa]